MSNILIKASAGTGKTFALATEAISLLLADEKPREFVGLTFSRAAAGEIFNRIASRLAEAAASEAGAQSETAHLLTVAQNGDQEKAEWVEKVWKLWSERGLVKTDGRGQRYLTPALFARLLRDYIHEQHVSRIGTIDSFMAQYVNSFPMELGLEGGMTIMDDYEVAQERKEAVDHLLQQGDHSDLSALFGEFGHATQKESTKLYSGLLDGFVKDSLELFQNYPRKEQWGDPQSIWGAEGVPYSEVGSSLTEVADEIEDRIIAALPDDHRLRYADGWPLIVEFIRNFNGSLSGMKTPLKNMFAAWDGDKSIGEFKFNRNDTNLSAIEEEVMSRALAVLVRETLLIRCRQTQGRYQLIERIAGYYDRATRRRGKLTFDDVPRLVYELDEVNRLNLEYRFDAQLTHWALDEFQDTSRLQWDTIGNLINEVHSDEGRRLFIVGDMKQAIYGWRGGDVKIFDEESASELYHELDLVKSYRYGARIAGLVNKVFDGELIRSWLSGSEASQVGENWNALWREHESHAGETDFVSVRLLEKSKDISTEDLFAKPIIEELKRVRPWERGITTGILVEKNDQGEALAERLRATDIPATWEGESSIADTPVIAAFLNLLHLSEHPADEACWQHLCATPLFTKQPFDALFKGRGDAMSKSRIAHRVASDLSRMGLARTLREYAQEHTDTFDEFTRERVDSLITAAISYSQAATAVMTASDFRDYIESFQERAAADSTTVRVLTVHRSKGLGFDYVILPFIDDRKITAVSSSGTFVAPDGSWLLDRRPAAVAFEHDTKLSSADVAERQRRAYDVLCRYYVAMTRAKKALSVYLSSSKSETAFVKYVADTLGELPSEAGNNQWYEAEQSVAAEAEVRKQTTLARRPRRRIVRATPSLLAQKDVSAAMLFRGEDAGTRRGSEIHDLLEKLEWLDDSAGTQEIVAACKAKGVDLLADTAFRRKLLRPDGFVELWRERNFEVMLDGAWLSGTMDRVVFYRTAEGRLKAEILDYKSNRKGEKESVTDFEARMRAHYAPQMQSYRKALQILTKLAETDISASLLLTETATCLPVE